MDFLSGYKVYIAGVGMIAIGIGECATGIAAGLGDGGGQYDGVMIASGLTKISLGLGMIGGRALAKKVTDK
jgi:hypothetical protein